MFENGCMDKFFKYQNLTDIKFKNIYKPTNSGIFINFLQGDGIEAGVNNFQSVFTGFYNGQEATLTLDIDRFITKFRLRNVDPKSEKFKKNAQVLFLVKKLGYEYANEIPKWRIGDKEIDDPKLDKEFARFVKRDYVRTSADESEFISWSLRNFRDIIESASSVLQDGALKFYFQINIEDDYVELKKNFLVNSLYGLVPEFIFSNVPKEIIPGENSVQLLIHQNDVNLLVNTLFHISFEIDILEEVKHLHDPLVLSFIKTTLNTDFFGNFFPGLKSEFGPNTKMNLKCGMSKNYYDNRIYTLEPSSIHFKNGSFDLSLGLGCKVMVDNGTPEWEAYRVVYSRIFINYTQEEFNNEGSSVLSSLNELKIKQINVLRDSKTFKNEEKLLTKAGNQVIEKFRKIQADFNSNEIFDNSSLIPKCFGLTLLKSITKLYDGYLVFLLDFDVISNYD